MNFMKRGLAVFLAVLLMMPTLPVSAEETVSSGDAQTVSGNDTYNNSTTVSGNEVSINASVDEVLFNTGNCAYSVVDTVSFENGKGDTCFAEDGSYTINIPEANPFFPYEVQFTHDGEVTNEWFMTPDDSVEVGGHTFYVSAYFDNTVVTQMSLNVAGDTVVVYPEAKEFTNDGGVMPISLMPLEEVYLTVDLSAYTPVELTMVSVDTIFAGENALTDTDKLVWTYSANDDYTISESGDKLNLSWGTCHTTMTTWQMIVGDADQLATDNIRYIVRLQVTESEDWLTSTVYTQDENGNRKNITVTGSYNDYYYEDSENREASMHLILVGDEVGDAEKLYLGLQVNSSVFAETIYDHIKIYKMDDSAADLLGEDITTQLLNGDMTQVNAGYQVSNKNNVTYGVELVIVGYDEAGNVIGSLPVLVTWYTRNNSLSYSFNKITNSGSVSPTYRSSSKYNGDSRDYTLSLYKGYAANDTYNLRLYYYKAGTSTPSAVTAAYVGKYSSIAEAAAAGATDIKDNLFNSSYYDGGYAADYSQGISFSIFVGEDGAEGQEIYYYSFKTEESDVVKAESLSSSTYVNFYGLANSNGSYINNYVVDYSIDSYAEYNYLTILVAEDVDLTKIAPIFSIDRGAKLYTSGSSTPEVSGKSYHDFSKGPVQYTLSAENGADSKNYWLQVIKATEGVGQLYINSLVDPESETRNENGTIYSTREVMLDGYHHNKHDILVANVGTEAISALSVELSSDVVELDEYWTLSGNYELSGLTTVVSDTSYGELPNLAKVCLKVKEGIEGGTDISGTLTFKSGDTTLMVLTLTGTVGDPCIITKDIPQAVKYVPYGTMIQNSNKYSWNTVSYSFLDGMLPNGMEVKENGEIYGVPLETGEFTFTVLMDNSYGSFDSDFMTYTLVVTENTNENVENATDTGYDLTQRVQNVNTNAEAVDRQTMVSEGIYAEFVDVYLDGEKLAEGTDYFSEEGSTRITILTQTLTRGGAGTHTLGIEFRTQDTGVLKRAAQNYEIYEESGTDEDDADSDNSGNDASNSESSNSGSDNSNVSSAAVASAVAASTEEVSYTVAAGDTLWKIAEKFYGSGEMWTKIYADNKLVISNPNVIYAGQVLTIQPTAESEKKTEVAEENSYTVEAGDSLWKIAKKLYGNSRYWRKIYQANSDIVEEPERIYAGQILCIPEK